MPPIPDSPFPIPQQPYALTRNVSSSLARCELTHLERVPIDVARAEAEHAEYERALAELGCTVRRLPSDDSMPDAVFIEDTAVVLDEVAVITRPGAPSRRGETTAVEAALRELRPLARITAPATLDGGDVLVLGRRVLVGMTEGGRSNEEGMRQLREHLAPHGYTVHAVPFRGCLHLKSGATALDADLVLLNPEMASLRALGAIGALSVHPAEPMAANVLALGGTLIVPEAHHRTAARLQQAGFTIRPVPAGELAKAEGGVTCCSLIVGGARGEGRGAKGDAL